jgi:hypothetical protein
VHWREKTRRARALLLRQQRIQPGHFGSRQVEGKCV